MIKTNNNLNGTVVASTYIKVHRTLTNIEATMIVFTIYGPNTMRLLCNTLRQALSEALEWRPVLSACATVGGHFVP